MHERVFQIIMRVPLGERKGQISFRQKGQKLEGTFEVMGNKNPFRGKMLSETALEIEVVLLTIIRSIPFTATGNIENRKLSMTLKEARHTYYIEGTEITEYEEIL